MSTVSPAPDQPQPALRPLRLFWFQGENFGDALSPLIVEHVSGRPVVHAHPSRAEIFSLGSLMGWIESARGEPAQGHKPILWGTGMLKPPVQTAFRRNIDVRALRGPLSNTLLPDVPRKAWGDPGIFVDEMLPDRPAQTDRIGIVPHHKLIGSPQLDALIAAVPDLLLIDVRTRDAMAVVRQIASCRFVLSSSLHGIVIADALGIANRWLDPRGNHACPELKFYDYATGIGRDLGMPLKLDEVAEFVRSPLPAGRLPYADAIAASKAALRAAFPARMRAPPPQPATAPGGDAAASGTVSMAARGESG